MRAYTHCLTGMKTEQQLFSGLHATVNACLDALPLGVAASTASQVTQHNCIAHRTRHSVVQMSCVLIQCTLHMAQVCMPK